MNTFWITSYRAGLACVLALLPALLGGCVTSEQYKQASTKMKDATATTPKVFKDLTTAYNAQEQSKFLLDHKKELTKRQEELFFAARDNGVKDLSNRVVDLKTLSQVDIVDLIPKLSSSKGSTESDAYVRLQTATQASLTAKLVGNRLSPFSPPSPNFDMERAVSVAGIIDPFQVLKAAKEVQNGQEVSASERAALQPAIDALEAVLKIDPKVKLTSTRQVTASLRAAVAALAKKKYDAAIGDYEVWLINAPEDSSVNDLYLMHTATEYMRQLTYQYQIEGRLALYASRAGQVKGLGATLDTKVQSDFDRAELLQVLDTVNSALGFAAVAISVEDAGE